MKQELFEGHVDDMKFDDPVKFKEYLEQHKDAKNVSYSHSIQEVADEQPKDVAKVNQEKELALVPPCINIDEYLDNPESVNIVEAKCNEYLEKHEQAIKLLNDEELVKHYNDLQDRYEHTKDMLKKNGQSILKINDTIIEFDDQIDEHTKKIEDIKAQIKTYKKVLEKLELAQDLLEMDHDTIKGAIADTKSKISIKHDLKEQEERNPLAALLDSLFLFF